MSAGRPFTGTPLMGRDMGGVDGDGSGELQDADGDEHQLTIAPGTDDRARSSKRANGRQSRCTAVASDAQMAV